MANWVVDNLENALDTWNDKLAEIWTLVTQSPKEFKGGDIWDVMVEILSLIHIFAFGVYLSTRKNYRRGEEYGSAKWGDVRAVNQKYRNRKFAENKILTNGVRISLDV